MEAAKSVNESGLVPNVFSLSRRRQDRAWKSMEELPISSFSWLTNKSRQRRSQSELLHASLASSSPTSSALMKESVLLPMRTHILTAREGILCEKHVSLMEDSQKESSSCLASPLGRDDAAAHASLLENTKPRETSSHNATLPKRIDTDVFIVQTDEELRKASPYMPTPLERANNAEDIPELECTNFQETVTQTSTILSGVDEIEQVLMIKPEIQERTHLHETSTQILTTISGVDDTEQAVLTKVGSQETSSHESVCSKGEDKIQHILQQNNEEMQEPFAHAPSPNRTDSEGYGKQAIQQTKGTVSQDTPLQISIKETEGTKYVADDMAHVSSEMRNMSVQVISSSISSSSHSQRDGYTLTQKNVELQETLTHTTVIEMSLRHHIQQDDAANEEAATRSFIMNRFLPAAKEVAAEHESSIAGPLVSKKHSEATAPSLPKQSQKIPVARRIKHSEGPTASLPHPSRRTPVARPSKSTAQQAPRAFTPSRPLHSWHQEDVMPYSMKSCGFICQGLKTALFRAHRTVSASARSTLRKKSWAPHPSNHVKVADASTSLIGCETEGPVAKAEAMGGKTKLQTVANTYAPVSPSIGSPNGVNVQESPRRHAIKHDLSERGCLSTDGCADARRNSSFSQSGKADLAGNQFEHVGSIQSRHNDPLTARNFAALKGKDYAEIAPEGVAQCSQQGTRECKSSSHCDHVEATPLSDSLPGEANASSGTSQDIFSGSEICNGKPAALDNAFRSARQDGDDEDDEEPQFFDALSRLNSLKSNASFYTMGSPRSEYEALRFEGLWINDERDFTDTSSHFETPWTHVSKSASVLSPVRVATEKGTTGKVSSLSQRIGKGLKLETESKEAKSPSEHSSPAFGVQPMQGEWWTESFSGLRHPSLESLNGLYSSKASTISPVFPAKCQNNSPNALGWPFGISTYQASRAGGGSPNLVQQEKTVEKNAVCGNVPSPPLPPSPTGSWLGKAITKNTSKTSPLATLQQREKVASARKKLDFVAANPDKERRWENVVKGSRVQSGHLRFSEELHHQHHHSNRNAIKPLKL